MSVDVRRFPTRQFLLSANRAANEYTTQGNLSGFVAWTSSAHDLIRKYRERVSLLEDQYDDAQVSRSYQMAIGATSIGEILDVMESITYMKKNLLRLIAIRNRCQSGSDVSTFADSDPRSSSSSSSSSRAAESRLSHDVEEDPDDPISGVVSSFTNDEEEDRQLSDSTLSHEDDDQSSDEYHDDSEDDNGSSDAEQEQDETTNDLSHHSEDETTGEGDAEDDDPEEEPEDDAQEAQVDSDNNGSEEEQEDLDAEEEQVSESRSKGSDPDGSRDKYENRRTTELTLLTKQLEILLDSIIAEVIKGKEERLNKELAIQDPFIRSDLATDAHHVVTRCIVTLGSLHATRFFLDSIMMAHEPIPREEPPALTPTCL